ncbi:TlpA family protein disulfide reductase [Agaribacterium sp. ZY112]|uniref:TlpA family protein disulfide reductase n=1 Tax=Agaribacterium sp. ZY112 TaxID=3233574 RepID=UPI0035264C98
MKQFLFLFTLVLASASSSSVLAETVPDFTLKSNQGKNLRISDMRGEVVMLNFWATWCGPCRQEMPLLDKIHARYSPVGFNLWGLNIDEDPKTANDYLKKNGVDFPILYDSNSEVRDIFKKHQGMPLSIFIDCDGNIDSVHRGYKPGDEKSYIKTIKKLIRSCAA